MTAALEPSYLSIGELAARPGPWWESVLGVVGFDRPPRIDVREVPLAASMTPSLGSNSVGSNRLISNAEGSKAEESSGEVCEVWRLAGRAVPAAAGEIQSSGRLQYRRGGPWLFGSLRISERDLAPGAAPPGAAALVRATELAYREIFAAIHSSGCPHLVRVWNYLPEINVQIDGDERYRHFNAARKIAFLNSGRATAGRVPAACALGSEPGSPLSIYFLAAREPPIAIENPRQMSAYHYPPEYGEQPPIFARASLLPEADGSNLFISGTASIVGHATRHAGDPLAQTRESFTNIAAVLEEANRVLGAQRYSLAAMTYKIYVRRPLDLACIAAETARILPRGAPLVYLRADVCREDLLVEIEASGRA
jgi:hypothetical protein